MPDTASNLLLVFGEVTTDYDVDNQPIDKFDAWHLPHQEEDPDEWPFWSADIAEDDLEAAREWAAREFEKSGDWRVVGWTHPMDGIHCPSLVRLRHKLVVSFAGGDDEVLKVDLDSHAAVRSAIGRLEDPDAVLVFPRPVHEHKKADGVRRSTAYVPVRHIDMVTHEVREEKTP